MLLIALGALLNRLFATCLADWMINSQRADCDFRILNSIELIEELIVSFVF